MRISDWSSDVCSSDLAGCGWRGNWAAHYLHGDPMADHFIQGSFAFTCSIAEAALIEEAWQLAADLMGDFDPADRQSVVWGKSVSVRVDLGGRRIIKKQKAEGKKSS